MSLVLAALTLSQEYGIPVFPVAHASKRPLVGRLRFDGTAWIEGVHAESDIACLGGFHRATTHAETITAWWAQWPDAGIGARLGGPLRLCMLEGDDACANAFLNDLASEWRTWTFDASRGTNRLFAAPADIAERPVRNLWPEQVGKGVEFKNGAGFVVLPPSVHRSGHVYRWADGSAPGECGLAPLPDGVAAEVRRTDELRLHAHDAQSGSGMPSFAHDDAALDLERVADAVRFLDADDYETWRDVGLALKRSGAPGARAVWDVWSASSSKYRQRTQDAQWRVMRPTSITVASIFHHAQRSGWAPGRRRAA